MSPINHERTFKKDKIGGKLYKFYLKAKITGNTACNGRNIEPEFLMFPGESNESLPL